MSALPLSHQAIPRAPVSIAEVEEHGKTSIVDHDVPAMQIPVANALVVEVPDYVSLRSWIYMCLAVVWCGLVTRCTRV